MEASKSLSRKKRAYVQILVHIVIHSHIHTSMFTHMYTTPNSIPMLRGRETNIFLCASMFKCWRMWMFLLYEYVSREKHFLGKKENKNMFEEKWKCKRVFIGGKYCVMLCEMYFQCCVMYTILFWVRYIKRRGWWGKTRKLIYQIFSKCGNFRRKK